MTAVTVHFCTGVKRLFFSLCSAYLLIFLIDVVALEQKT